MTRGGFKIILSVSGATDGGSLIFDGGSGDDISVGALGQVTVSNAVQLVKALASERHIKLMPGSYDLSSVPADTALSPGVSRIQNGEILLNGINGLTLEGIGTGTAEICSSNGAANVLSFLNCKNISITNIKLSHKSVTASSASALFFSDSANVKISSSILAGPCSSGLEAVNCINIEFISSIIENCTESILKLNGVSSAAFKQAVFRNNRGADMIVIADSSDVSFDGCTISNNLSVGGSFSFFNISVSGVSFTNSSISDNSALQPQSKLGGAKFTNVASHGNSFRFDFPYTADDIGPRDLGIGVIDIGVTVDKLTGSLASPITRLDVFSDGGSFAFDTVYHYMGLDAAISGNYVVALRANDNYTQSRRGIKIGDTVEAVYNKYGYADDINGELLYPYTDANAPLDSAIYVYFKIVGGKVSAYGIRP
jgi:hypothetical protein